MARALDSLLTLQQMTLHDPEAWIWLYELEVPSDPPTRYRLTNYKTAVLFGTNSSGTACRPKLAVSAGRTGR